MTRSASRVQSNKILTIWVMLPHTSRSFFSKLAVTPGQCFPSLCFQSEQDTDRWSASRLSKEVWTIVDQPPWYGHSIDRTHSISFQRSNSAEPEGGEISDVRTVVSILVPISGSLVAMSQANNVFGERDRTSYHLITESSSKLLQAQIEHVHGHLCTLTFKLSFKVNCEKLVGRRPAEGLPGQHVTWADEHSCHLPCACVVRVSERAQGKNWNLVRLDRFFFMCHDSCNCT